MYLLLLKYSSIWAGLGELRYNAKLTWIRIHKITVIIGLALVAALTCSEYESCSEHAAAQGETWKPEQIYFVRSYSKGMKSFKLSCGSILKVCGFMSPAHMERSVLTNDSRNVEITCTKRRWHTPYRVSNDEHVCN